MTDPEQPEPPLSDVPVPVPVPALPIEPSWGHPAFARSFPRDPELDRLVAAFARGDYEAVRTDAPKLVASSEDPAIKQAANMLRDRIEPDPTSKYLFLLASLLLAFLTAWWVAHDGPPEGTRPIRPAPRKVEHVD